MHDPVIDMANLKKEGEFGSKPWCEACAAAAVTILKQADLPLDIAWAFTVRLEVSNARKMRTSCMPPSKSSWAERIRPADAMVSMASGYLSGNDQQTRNSSDDYLVTIHVDQSALAEGNGRSSLPIESVKRLCCDGQAVVIGEDEKGEPLNIGRKTRTVPTAIKRALQARDKGCSFPGCHNTRFVDAHHIEHWSAGGETSLDNLMLLCSQHHKLVHEGGFSIERDYQNHWYFKRPDGRAVPACGYHAEDITDDDIGDLSHQAGPRSRLFNNPPAGGLLSGVDNFVSDLGPACREPASPTYWH